jgi:hypothetical protein
VKADKFSFVREALKAAAVLVSMTTKERRGPTPRQDDEGHCITIPFLQHATWWQTAEWLALLFRRTRAERHRTALRRHLAAAYARLIEGGEQ